MVGVAHGQGEPGTLGAERRDLAHCNAPRNRRACAPHGTCTIHDTSVEPGDAAAEARGKDRDDDVDALTASPQEKDASDGMFSCNVCMEMASHPVVTLCGHLYCWPCLYKWLQMQQTVRTCPVCKAGVDRDKVIPVYGRGGNGDPRKNSVDVGARPVPQRPVPVVLGVGAQNHVAYMPSMNFFGGYGGSMTPEQQHQAFLSRLLLMLGSFVIMCLLLF